MFSDQAAMKPIKVLLVIEVPLIASIFASVLEDEPDIHVVGQVTTIQEALKFIQGTIFENIAGCPRLDIAEGILPVLLQ